MPILGQSMRLDKKWVTSLHVFIFTSAFFRSDTDKQQYSMLPRAHFFKMGVRFVAFFMTDYFVTFHTVHGVLQDCVLRVSRLCGRQQEERKRSTDRKNERSHKIQTNYFRNAYVHHSNSYWTHHNNLWSINHGVGHIHCILLSSGDATKTSMVSSYKGDKCIHYHKLISKRRWHSCTIRSPMESFQSWSTFTLGSVITLCCLLPLKHELTVYIPFACFHCYLAENKRNCNVVFWLMAGCIMLLSEQAMWRWLLLPFINRAHHPLNKQKRTKKWSFCAWILDRDWTIAPILNH